LRAAIEYEVTRQTVPGAIRMDPEELDDRHEEIPRDCDVVLYCTCPNEATSARAALALKRRGIERVFPLQGGLEAWVSCGYPVDVTPDVQHRRDTTGIVKSRTSNNLPTGSDANQAASADCGRRCQARNRATS
jgi:rhodanese-related sulfurtransferase